MNTTNDDERAEWWKDAQLAHNHLDTAGINRVDAGGRRPLADRVLDLVTARAKVLAGAESAWAECLRAEKRALEATKRWSEAERSGREQIAAVRRQLADLALQHAESRRSARQALERVAEAQTLLDEAAATVRRMARRVMLAWLWGCGTTAAVAVLIMVASRGWN